MKPKMLFVDDRTKRIHYALEEYGKEYDVTIATCVPEALRALCSQEWDIVSLDHDLNGHDFQDPDSTGCGMEIVRYIVKTGGWNLPYKIPKFRVHSKNLFAAHLMYAVFSKIGIPMIGISIKYPDNNMKYDKEGLPIK